MDAGLQVPAIPLSEVSGKTGTADPAQNVVGIANTGTSDGVIVTFSVKAGAHATDGVKT